MLYSRVFRVLYSTFELFRQVDNKTLNHIAGQLRPRGFQAGEFILRKDDHGDSMFFINSGRVMAVVKGVSVN
jgi:CRP-like cAMP-binding protein